MNKVDAGRDQEEEGGGGGRGGRGGRGGGRRMPTLLEDLEERHEDTWPRAFLPPPFKAFPG